MPTVEISKLKMRMMEMGIKQYVLAALCEIAPSRISEYSMLRRTIPAHHLPKLCGALHCQPEEIVGKIQIDEEFHQGILG